jgi:hypothetical protein
MGRGNKWDFREGGRKDAGMRHEGGTVVVGQDKIKK